MISSTYSLILAAFIVSGDDEGVSWEFSRYAILIIKKKKSKSG